MNKFQAFLVAGVLMVSAVPAMAADSDSCTSGLCQTADKSWKTVRNGTVDAAHDTKNWGSKTGTKVGHWGSKTGKNIGRWGKNTTHTVGKWGSNTAKDTKNFVVGQ
ncbi:hypothetical protein [Acetobacter conturbans]|uniref:Uncharacterized protein n=1 Tax=Acetobacter conturbans TaxID=1737472 RepID=A0ABX0K828_9PROT|nr:hypothetical protein [Acetobacter conturbans]NHN89559.1 hypothetical protein [Acetobacter conturbans]